MTTHILNARVSCPLPGSAILWLCRSDHATSFSLMSQSAHGDLERGNNSGVYYLLLRPDLSRLTNIYKTDGNQTQSAPNRPSKEEPSFGDRSGPFFSMYSDAAEEEDNEMVRRWQKDADGILIFVSPWVCIYIVLCMTWNAIDRFILCCRCRAPWCDSPGPETKQSRYLRILSWQHL